MQPNYWDDLGCQRITFKVSGLSSGPMQRSSIRLSWQCMKHVLKCWQQSRLEKDTQTKQNDTLVYLCFVLMVRPTSLTVCPLKNDIQNIILASELYWGWLIKVGENCLPHYWQGTTQGKKQRWINIWFLFAQTSEGNKLCWSANNALPESLFEPWTVHRCSKALRVRFWFERFWKSLRQNVAGSLIYPYNPYTNLASCFVVPKRAQKNSENAAEVDCKLLKTLPTKISR